MHNISIVQHFLNKKYRAVVATPCTQYTIIYKTTIYSLLLMHYCNLSTFYLFYASVDEATRINLFRGQRLQMYIGM